MDASRWKVGCFFNPLPNKKLHLTMGTREANYLYLTRSNHTQTHESQTIYYRVFWVNYTTRLPKADFHRSLFIAIEDSKVRRGPVYEVKGPKHPEGDAEYREYYLSFKINKSPEASMHFHSIKHLGFIKDADVSKVIDICENIPPPVVPLCFQGESPNSCDWINNLLYRLNKRRLIQFRDDFQVASSEVALVHNALQRRKSSSAGNSSPSASDSSSASKQCV